MSFRIIKVLLLVVSLLPFCRAATAAESATFDVYVDPKGKPLAAYQVKIWTEDSGVGIVAIEGGEHPAYQAVPYFDPKAMQKNAIKLADFSLAPSGKLPSSRTRIASVRVEFQTTPPNFVITVEAAATTGGRKIPLEALLIRKE